MNLHRSRHEPEWTHVKPANQNNWQQIAARTHGIMTPGNIVTLAGFLLVLAGMGMFIAQHHGLGLGLIVLGRLCDVADGWVAAATHTKSPLGELFDATVDKIVLGLGIGMLGVVGIVPLWVLLLLVLPQLGIVAIFLYARQHRQTLHPSRSGKLSMAAVWVSLVLFAVSKLAAPPVVDVLIIFGIVLAFVAALFGGKAAGGYFATATSK